jgi:DNA polymerase
LALGYGGGVNALKAFGADKMGMSDEEMQETVDLWRESSPRITALWRSLEKAAIRCVSRRTSTVSDVGDVRFDFEDGTLWMTLPSGRRIAYVGAAYEESRFHTDRKSLTYMGTEQQTRKWARLETWGGKLTENLVQATARDCLREAMLALDAAGFDIRAHVHDEVIVTEPIGGRSVDEMSALMGREIPWAPGLPLRADGYEGAYYFKD